MALIENSKGRESGGGYERLFGNQLLGHLLSRVQASVITSGNELEHVIIAHSKSIADVDSFLAQQELPPGTYLITNLKIIYQKNCSLPLLFMFVLLIKTTRIKLWQGLRKKYR